MFPKPITQNTLFYGDNLTILQEYLPTESIDLVYLDPPFNSNRSYNVLFKDESGSASEAQLTAFEDSWHWGPQAERTYQDLITYGPADVCSMISALRSFIHENQMLAYLVMMTARLVELHRVLKPTGSLYLHCDPTASHYLKVILDTIFGAKNFVNEIVWKRSDAKGDTGQGAKHLGRVNDIIFYYAKHSGEQTFNPQFTQLDKNYIDKWYRHTDPDGRRYKLDNMLGPGGAAKGNPQYEVMGVTRYWRYSQERMQQLIESGRVIQTKPGAVPMYKRYLDETKGAPLTTNWADIRPIHGWASEKLGYPTQKPLELLERIIKISSNPGDWVLDPFCGCGTAVAAAQKLGRNWIGIDITHLSISLQKYRLKDMFGIEAGKDYQVIGEPTSLGAARQLAKDDKFQFQWWALSLIKAKPVGGEQGSKKGRKGGDRGIDGILHFVADSKGRTATVIVQVKGGRVKPGDVRDLIGTVNNQKAAIGVLLTLEDPTPEMITAAVSAGFYHSDLWQKDCPKIQILTVKDLLEGKQVQMPPAYGTFKLAPKVKSEEGTQGDLGI